MFKLVLRMGFYLNEYSWMFIVQSSIHCEFPIFLICESKHSSNKPFRVESINIHICESKQAIPYYLFKKQTISAYIVDYQT